MDRRGWKGTRKGFNTRSWQPGWAGGWVGCNSTKGRWRKDEESLRFIPQMRTPALEVIPIDDTNRQWYHKIPRQLWGVVGDDLDFTRSLDDPIKLEAMISGPQPRMINPLAPLLFCQASLRQGMRNPFYCWSSSFERAQHRFNQPRWKGRFTRRPGVIVYIDVWKLCKAGKLMDSDFINLSDLEAQQDYFNHDEAFHTQRLQYQRDHNEWLTCFKGDDNVIRDMIVVDEETGDPRAPLIALIERVPASMAQAYGSVVGEDLGWRWRRNHADANRDDQLPAAQNDQSLSQPQARAYRGVDQWPAAQNDQCHGQPRQLW